MRALRWSTMEEHPEMSENARSEVPASIERKRWLIDFIIVLAVAVSAFGYGYQQRLKVRDLAAQGSGGHATINDPTRQLNLMTDKLTASTAAEHAPAVPGA